MAKRLLAVLAAAALIVGAVMLRRAIDDDSNDGTDGPSTTRPSSLVTVWCLEDLREVCEAAFGDDAEVTIASMSGAIAALSAADVDDDLPSAWVTFAPLPEMAKDAVARAGGPGDSVATSSDLVATTRLVVATRPDRAALLAGACADPALWRCLGRLAGTKWSAIGGSETLQNVKPAFGDPTTSATALMVWASAVGHYLGLETYNINDVNADDGFPAWGRNLRAADPLDGAGDPLGELVLSRVQRDVAGGTEAALSRLTGLSQVGAAYGRVDVVVAGFAGATLPDALRTRLVAALGEHGWAAADATTTPAARPGFTTYVALQTTWKDLG